MCCILERAAQDFYSSPYRLTDKPTGYGPVFRGSNPRRETKGEQYDYRWKTSKKRKLNPYDSIDLIFQNKVLFG